VRPRLTDDGRTVTLDLHGARIDEALGLVRRAARLAAARGRGSLKVVHGASTSGGSARTIRDALHALLDDGALAPDVADAVRFDGHALLGLRPAPRPDPPPLRLLDVLEAAR
jgi:DNA-nicking Smr family endonuclease